jgi:hypothetical protein
MAAMPVSKKHKFPSCVFLIFLRYIFIIFCQAYRKEFGTSWQERRAENLNRHCERSAAIQIACRIVDCFFAALLACDDSHLTHHAPIQFLSRIRRGDRDCEVKRQHPLRWHRLTIFGLASVLGWGGRVRTCEWRHQKPLPYHLATPQQ